eukprot:7613186-Pyramimonas_sp.AAC.1
MPTTGSAAPCDAHQGAITSARHRGSGLAVMVGISNRDHNAGEPASPKPEEDDQQGDNEANYMAEAVDPMAAAPVGYASDYSDALSTVTDVTYDADTPIDPRCIVTGDM